MDRPPLPSSSAPPGARGQFAVVPSRGFAAALLARLSAGEVISGRVVEAVGPGLYLFTVRGQNLIAASSVPLQSDSVVQVERDPQRAAAQGADPDALHLRLRPLAADAQASSPSAAAQVVTHLSRTPGVAFAPSQLPPDQSADAAADPLTAAQRAMIRAAFAAAEAPLDPARLAAAERALAQLAGELAAGSDAAESAATSPEHRAAEKLAAAHALLARHVLPTTPALVALALRAVAGGLPDLASALGDLARVLPRETGLARAPLPAGSPASAHQSALPTAVTPETQSGSQPQDPTAPARSRAGNVPPAHDHAATRSAVAVHLPTAAGAATSVLDVVSAWDAPALGTSPARGAATSQGVATGQSAAAGQGRGNAGTRVTAANLSAIHLADLAQHLSDIPDPTREGSAGVLRALAAAGLRPSADGPDAASARLFPLLARLAVLVGQGHAASTAGTATGIVAPDAASSQDQSRRAPADTNADQRTAIAQHTAERAAGPAAASSPVPGVRSPAGALSPASSAFMVSTSPAIPAAVPAPALAPAPQLAPATQLPGAPTAGFPAASASPPAFVPLVAAGIPATTQQILIATPSANGTDPSAPPLPRDDELLGASVPRAAGARSAEASPLERPAPPAQPPSVPVPQAPLPQAQPGSELSLLIGRSLREAAADTVFVPRDLADYDHVFALPLQSNGIPTPARLAVASRQTQQGSRATWLRVDAELSQLGALSVRLSGADGGPIAITILASRRTATDLAADLPALTQDLHDLGLAAAVRILADEGDPPA